MNEMSEYGEYADRVMRANESFIDDLETEIQQYKKHIQELKFGHAALAAQVEALRERHAQICRDLKIWQPLADSPSRIANDKLEQAALAILNDTPEAAREREQKRDMVIETARKIETRGTWVRHSDEERFVLIGEKEYFELRDALRAVEGK